MFRLWRGARALGTTSRISLGNPALKLTAPTNELWSGGSLRFTSSKSSSTISPPPKSSQSKLSPSTSSRSNDWRPQISPYWFVPFFAFLFWDITGLVDIQGRFADITIKQDPQNSEYSRIHKFRAPRYGSLRNMKKAIVEIEEALGKESISIDEEDLKLHGYSEWSPSNIDKLPIAVAYPKSTDEVSIIAKICHRYRVPMIGYSGGSSLEGNFSAPHGGISVDFMHMDKIVAFHEEDMDVVVQPSYGWVDLNSKIADSGLFFPVDPSPSAKFGGMVGTNCSGTNAVRYGPMRDWVISLTVVLADGSIVKTRNRPRKSAAGYNLNGIFVGAEGTLGLVTEITLKLAVIPKEFSVAVVNFPSIRDAASTASAVMRAGIPVAALEFLDATQMAVLNKGGYTAPKFWAEKATLFFKFSGSKASVADNIKEVKNISQANNGGLFEFAKGEQEQQLLWSARKQALWSLLAARPEGTELWTTDVAVPLSKLAEMIETSTEGLKELGLFSSIVGHLGDGNYHEAIMYHKDDPVEVAAVDKHVRKMISRALELEGTSTGEHSIGFFKKHELLQEVGPEALLVMKSIKQSLDPRWLMNPGKIFDTPIVPPATIFPIGFYKALGLDKDAIS